MEFSIPLHTIMSWWFILYNGGPKVIISKKFVFLSLQIIFILAYRADPDEMLHYRAFHLGFHCLPKYLIGPVKQIFCHKIAIIYLSISLNMCFGCSKEPSHWDGSFQYPLHMFWFRNKKNNFQLCTLNWGPGTCLAVSCLQWVNLYDITRNCHCPFLLFWM